MRRTGRTSSRISPIPPNEPRVNAYIPHMVRHLFLIELNALLFDADRGQQRIALGLGVACLLMGPSLSALPWSVLWVAVPLLFPRRAA